MIPHLHLHLEPEERKRRSLGSPSRAWTGRDVFFASHDLAAADRARVTAADLAGFLHEVHAEQRDQGVDYVELRLSPRRFLSDGMSWTDFLDLSAQTLASFAAPRVRAILLVNRDSPEEFVDQCRQRIADGLPEVYVGLDLAGDELRFPDVARFRPLFEDATRAGLGTVAHAGEFGGAEHIWRAIDDLGARRVGHGVSAAGSQTLMRRLSDDGILVECSLSSNLSLGAVGDGRAHPVLAFLQHAVPISLNSDIPLHTGHTLATELELASKALSLTPDDLLALQTRAYSHRFRRSSPLPG